VVGGSDLGGLGMVREVEGGVVGWHCRLGAGGFCVVCKELDKDEVTFVDD